MPHADASLAPIVITGAAQRIGLALARHFLARRQPVMVSYRTRYPAVEQLESLGAICLAADFSTDDGINSFAQDVIARAPRLRALIHNASSWQPETPDTPAADTLHAMLQIHVNTPYLLNLALAPLLQNQGQAGADIIHLTDFVTDKGSENHIAYAASKAALENLTLSFARKLAPAVKVNAIAPSMIMFNPEDDYEYRRRALDKSLMKLAPGPEEIVALVDYLLSSRFVTGRTFNVDGGRHLR